MIVLVLISHSDSLLLVKLSHIDDTWGLAGGIVEYGSPIDATATVYVKEQTGLEITLSRIVGIYTSEDDEVLTITFHGEIKDDNHDIGTEHQQYAEFFSPEELPAVDEVHYRYIEDYLLQNYSIIFSAR
ncbi:MAG: NUDIX domain-containing protein [Spirochaetaceae bacterium]|nr:MAG: NUDIX domain-containing protein [Spirochaetaceae bacterium]